MSAAHNPGFIRVPVYDAADITRFFRPWVFQQTRSPR